MLTVLWANYVCMYVELETTTAPGQPPIGVDSSGCVFCFKGPAPEGAT